jgi:hypothetical protein
MVSSGMLRRVALVRTDLSKERITSIIRVTRTGELGKTLTVISNIVLLRCVLLLLATVNAVPTSTIFVILKMNAILSSETSVLRRGTRRTIPVGGRLQAQISATARK